MNLNLPLKNLSPNPSWKKAECLTSYINSISLVMQLSLENTCSTAVQKNNRSSNKEKIIRKPCKVNNSLKIRQLTLHAHNQWMQMSKMTYSEQVKQKTFLKSLWSIFRILKKIKIGCFSTIKMTFYWLIRYLNLVTFCRLIESTAETIICICKSILTQKVTNNGFTLELRTLGRKSTYFTSWTLQNQV